MPRMDWFSREENKKRPCSVFQIAWSNLARSRARVWNEACLRTFSPQNTATKRSARTIAVRCVFQWAATSFFRIHLYPSGPLHSQSMATRRGNARRPVVSLAPELSHEQDGSRRPFALSHILPAVAVSILRTHKASRSGTPYCTRRLYYTKRLSGDHQEIIKKPFRNHRMLRFRADQIEEWCSFFRGCSRAEFGDWQSRT